MKLSDLIREVCRLGDAERAFIDAQLAKTHSGQKYAAFWEWELDDTPSAPAREELGELLHAQSPALLCMLLTVWRLGCGHFDARDDFLREYMESGDRCKDVDDMIDYLMSKNLAWSLEIALPLLADVGINVDDLLN